MLPLCFIILTCLASAPGYDQGQASYYGWESARHPMANGKKFNPSKHTAASYRYPLGTVLEVSTGGRRVVVTVTDRGPAKRLHRLIDLSESAASCLGYRQKGLADVSVMVMKYAPN